MNITVIAYTYESDVHCPDCTRERFPQMQERVPYCDLKDRDGNPIHPVFSTEFHDFTACSDCGERIL